MNSVQKKRLLKLAAFLRTVPRKHFNLEVIIGLCKTLEKNDKVYMARSKIVKGLNKVKKDLKPHNYCVAACAIGWMPAAFNHHLKWNGDGKVVFRQYKYEDCTESNFEAARKFFTINNRQSNYLFMPESYHPSKRGPCSVANRIEKFVESGGKTPEEYAIYEM